MTEENIKKLALIIAANCMNGSIIQACHQQKNISDTELTTFNHQLSDRIYTFLIYLLSKPSNEYAFMMEAMLENYPENWDQPVLDQQLLNSIKGLEKEATSIK